MNIDHFINSELKITASEHLDISNDLQSQQNHSISDLINNEKTKEIQENQENKENQNETE